MTDLQSSSAGQVAAVPAQPHTGSSVRTYLIIAVILAVFTLIEVQLPNWLESQRTLLIVSLLVAAFAKAALVMMFYMHLKYDSRIYTGIVILSIVLITYFLALLALVMF